MRIYFYKLSADNFGAPHVMKGLLSLAICKPMIRSSAEVGDIIFGFASDSLDSDNRLIYAAKVTEKVLNGDYYKLKKYRSRWDCIYNWDGTHYEWRKGSYYHGGQGDMTRDLGNSPEYSRANVLISNDFRYFGKHGTCDYKSLFSTIKITIEGLKQGHRVNHKKEVEKELMALKDQVWCSNVIGEPTTIPRRAKARRSCRG